MEKRINPENQNLIPSWFFHVLYITGLVISVVWGYTRTENIKDSRVLILETEQKYLKERVYDNQKQIEQLKQLYLNGLQKIEGKLDDLKKLVDN